MQEEIQPATRDEDAQDEEAEKVRKNELSSVDYLWASFHGLTGLVDIGFLWALHFSDRWSGLLAFTGSLSVWNAALSVTCHFAALRAILSVQPCLIRYSLRAHTRRDEVYRQSALRFSQTITLSTLTLVLYSLPLLAAHFDRHGHSWSHEVNVFAASWLSFLLQRPRHWLCAPNRFLVKRGLFLEVPIGQSGIHRLVNYYVMWQLLLRLWHGRWETYPILDSYEAGNTAVAFALHLGSMFLTLHAIAWVVWRFAHACCSCCRY